MKFTTSSADLKNALDIVGGAVPSKSTLPILECVLFERADDQLKLSATDLEISIVERFDVNFQDDGSERIAVPARRLLDTLRALPDLPIEFSTSEELHVALRTDQGHYKMIGHDASDFPGIPSFEESRELDVPSELLQRAMQKAGFAVSKDALRPAMMGILFQIKNNGTQVVATDGHRLVQLTLKGITSEEPIDFIVPSKALSLASRVAESENCKVAVGGGFASFDYGNTTVLARLIDESYPNYEAVIPKDNDRILSINRQSMLQAVKRVALYSSSMTHQIRLSLKENQIDFSAEDIERASEAREHVLGEYADEPMDIGFNSVYLTEVLSNLDADEVTFKLSSPNRAGVIEPAEQSEDETVLMLIMPVMLTPSYG